MYCRPMRIDLHTHSHASDGTDSPAMLVGLAAQAGLDIVGLTDHDTVEGWSEAEQAVPDAGIILIRGMEMTAHMDVDPAEHPRGRSRVSVHMLGYLFNPRHQALVNHIQAMHDTREERAREMVALLSKDYSIHWESVQRWRQPGAPIGRPHIADALVAAGYGADRSEIFRTILHPHGKYYVPTASPSALDTVQWINAAGGKAVIAHPKANKRGNFLPDSAFDKLKEAGLFGAEVDHRDNAPEIRPALRDLLTRLALYPLGASDYHGTGKPNRLGEHTTDVHVYEALIDGAFLSPCAPV